MILLTTCHLIHVVNKKYHEVSIVHVTSCLIVNMKYHEVSILRVTTCLTVNMKYHDTNLTMPRSIAMLLISPGPRYQHRVSQYYILLIIIPGVSRILYNTRSMWSTGSISILLSSGVVVVLVSVEPFDPPLEN